MIGIVIGTRPELIKLRPVARALKRLGVPCKIIYTEQHEAIRKDVGDLATEVNGHRQCVWVKPLEGWEWKPTAIVVQGDTDSARQWALDAAFKRIPVIHVEAGLRTTHQTMWAKPVPQRAPFPEELNRQLISRVAALHLCPTYANERNLWEERVGGIRQITGNPGITALVDELQAEPCIAAFDYLIGIPYALVTCHRRENWPYMQQLATELKRVQSKIKVQLIKHPNSRLYDGINTDGLSVLDPVSHHDLVAMLRTAYIVVTDSGGVIEEATWLGVRRASLRTETERPEAQAPLVGPIEGCAERILAALDQEPPSEGSRFAFGDEKSADNCANAIANFYKELT